MKYYHYTSCWHLSKILNDGVINTTCSNLMEPVNPRIVNGSFISDTDNYKPVVWLTDTLDFDNAGKNGLENCLFDKTECAIEIEAAFWHNIQKWDVWAEKNGINPSWEKALKDTGPNWRSWYISEKPIEINENTSIIFRPDIMEKLNKGESVDSLQLQ